MRRGRTAWRLVLPALLALLLSERQPLASATHPRPTCQLDVEALLARPASAPWTRAYLLEKLRKEGLPAFLKRGGDRELPVVLLDERAYSKLKPELDSSLGVAIELEVRGGKHDHGRVRVGRRLMDYGTPGTRYAGWDPHGNGILGRPMDGWMADRQGKFAHRTVHDTPDRMPMRVIEVVYPLTREQKEAADVYFRARQGAVWRVDYFWGNGSQEGMPWILRHRDGGAEHCFSFGTGSQTQFHRWAIQDQLYNHLGVREDIGAWLARPEARRLQEEARRRILSMPYSDADPATWAQVSAHSLEDLFPIVEPIAPRGLSAEQRRALVNFVFADRAIADYQKVVAELGIREDNMLDLANPRAAGVFVYEGPHATDGFRSGRYEYNGAVFGIQDRGTQRPL
jgi:hypothetical protein